MVQFKIKGENYVLYRADIIKTIKSMDLPINEYCITSGAGLVIHGVKDNTNDIDLGCNTCLIECFIENGCEFTITEDKSRIVKVNDSIELIENWFVDEITIIDNLPIATLNSIKKQKLELGREKDIRDIKLIDAYLNI